MSGHASSEDCPCCHTEMKPGPDTDRALVVAFLGGVSARELRVPIGAALCATHARMAAECVAFVSIASSTPGGPTS